MTNDTAQNTQQFAHKQTHDDKTGANRSFSCENNCTIESCVPDEHTTIEHSHDASVPSESSSAVATAGKIAMSAMLATSLAAALGQAPRKDLITLPDPVPIVRVLEAPTPSVVVEDDNDTDKRAERIKRLLKILKFLAAALLLVAALIFGLLKGCSSCTAATPTQHEEASESSSIQLSSAIILTQHNCVSTS